MKFTGSEILMMVPATREEEARALRRRGFELIHGLSAVNCLAELLPDGCTVRSKFGELWVRSPAPGVLLQEVVDLAWALATCPAVAYRMDREQEVIRNVLADFDPERVRARMEAERVLSELEREG